MTTPIVKVPEEVPCVFTVYNIGDFWVVSDIGAAINEPIIESGRPGDAVWDTLERLFMRLTP